MKGAVQDSYSSMVCVYVCARVCTCVSVDLSARWSRDGYGVATSNKVVVLMKLRPGAQVRGVVPPLGVDMGLSLQLLTLVFACQPWTITNVTRILANECVYDKESGGAIMYELVSLRPSCPCY